MYTCLGYIPQPVVIVIRDGKPAEKTYNWHINNQYGIRISSVDIPFYRFFLLIE